MGFSGPGQGTRVTLSCPLPPVPLCAWSCVGVVCVCVCHRESQGAFSDRCCVIFALSPALLRNPRDGGSAPDWTWVDLRRCLFRMGLVCPVCGGAMARGSVTWAGVWPGLPHVQLRSASGLASSPMFSCAAQTPAETSEGFARKQTARARSRMFSVAHLAARCMLACS